MLNEPFEFFMLRRASLPARKLSALQEQCGGDFQKWEAALLDLFETEPFHQAIYLASPSLHSAMAGYDKQAPEKSRRKLLLPLYKYLIRMSSRATPFGLFSVTGTGLISNHTKLSGPAISSVKKSVRLRMAALKHIAAWLEKQDIPGKQIRYTPNNSLYKTPTGFRYVESIKSGETLGSSVSEVELFPELAVLLKAAAKRRTKTQLANALGRLLSREQSKQLIQELIDLDLLVSGLSPNVTGPDFQDRLIECLGSQRLKSTDAEKLYKLIQGLSRQDSVNSLQDMQKELCDMLPSLRGEPLFRAQLTAATDKVTFGKTAMELLAADFAAVKGLLQNNHESGPLNDLKQKFLRRYGNRQIPLCELLDSEMGIEYAGLAMQAGRPAPLLYQLKFSPSPFYQVTSENAISQVKHGLLDRALTRQLYRVEILESDLKGLPAAAAEQTGYYWLGELNTGSAKKIDRGNFEFYLKAAGGQSGLELMARFAHEDPRLGAHLSRATKELADQDSENLHAEIAHIPDLRMAAVLSRPHLWPYEIPYLSQSTLPESRQIAVNDILVSLSQDGSIVLTSRRLSKRIIPHNTTAHNYGLGLPVYQFLSDVAYQQSRVIAWSWEHLENFSFLPRVCYRHLILSPARWNFSPETRHLILAALESDPGWAQVAKRLRIPRFIQIRQGDNLLLIDCQNRFAKELLREELQKNDHLQIQEYLQPHAKHPVKDVKGSYAHELVLAFKPSATRMPSAAALPGNEPRFFHLGSEWIYVKIFTAAARADKLLTEVLTGLCERLTREGHLIKWFYVRYFDPSHHLRLRFQVADQDGCWQLVLGRLQSAIEDCILSSAIEKIQTDTYERELERYHSLPFEKAESIFHQDSIACLKVISILELQAGDQQRWLAALYNADAMLCDFGLNIQQRADFAQKSYEGFLAEFNQDRRFTQQLDKKYRKFRPLIQQVLDGQAPYPVILSNHFKERSLTIRKLRKEAISMTEISGYVHMSLNRLLESNHRKQEMILFHFLSKHYTSAANYKNT